MARIRTIKPEFPHSESMGRVSRDARLLFVQLWTICDDSGRTRGASRMLASLLFPYDDDAPTLIDKWLGELEREGCIRFYDHDGSRYLEVRNWLNHQRIDKPSGAKCPAPREDSRGFARAREASGEDLDRDHDLEKDHDPHIQPCPVREGNLPEPAKAARVPVSNPPRTDADLRPLFDAYCAGTGQRLTWRHQYVLPCEQIAVLTRDAAVVQRAARFYAQALGVGITPSLQRFAAEFDKWRAESERPAREATKQRRDDPRFGAPSPAAKRLWCSRCMTTHPEGQHVGGGDALGNTSQDAL